MWCKQRLAVLTKQLTMRTEQRLATRTKQLAMWIKQQFTVWAKQLPVRPKQRLAVWANQLTMRTEQCIAILAKQLAVRPKQRLTVLIKQIPVRSEQRLTVGAEHCLSQRRLRRLCARCRPLCLRSFRLRPISRPAVSIEWHERSVLPGQTGGEAASQTATVVGLMPLVGCYQDASLLSLQKANEKIPCVEKRLQLM